jgi:hypothetical protein
MTKKSIQTSEDFRRPFFVLSLLALGILVLIVIYAITDFTDFFYGVYNGLLSLFAFILIAATALGIYVLKHTKKNSKQRLGIVTMFIIDATLTALVIIGFGIPWLLVELSHL